MLVWVNVCDAVLIHDLDIRLFNFRFSQPAHGCAASRGRNIFLFRMALSRVRKRLIATERLELERVALQKREQKREEALQKVERDPEHSLLCSVISGPF